MLIKPYSNHKKEKRFRAGGIKERFLSHFIKRQIILDVWCINIVQEKF